ncbi:hypothetical protein AV645_08675 [Acinetobacter calcoaceticus]|uniref:Uncharacterized protein n=1 Tax=Acinetobacter oleivorans TaxID=1148157 RepID=A0A0B2U836_9GAMM|nr:hypothetical protein DH17_16365 [Acinetobacter oleivorans]KUM11728.1 hypothetical protein AV645_08675 [Acinetobacter calcoaceticus]
MAVRAFFINLFAHISLITLFDNDFHLLFFVPFYNLAEQHITNLYSSLPKALMFASCQNLESCKSLFDEPTKQAAK